MSLLQLLLPENSRFVRNPTYKVLQFPSKPEPQGSDTLTQNRGEGKLDVTPPQGPHQHS